MGGSEPDVDDSPAEVEAGLVVRDALVGEDARSFPADVEGDLSRIGSLLADGSYDDAGADPTVVERIKRRLELINDEFRYPTVEGDLDIGMIRAAVLSLIRETQPFHADEAHGPALDAVVAAVGDDLGSPGVPTKILEEFDESSNGPLALNQDDEVTNLGDSPAEESERQPILQEIADPSLPGPYRAARAMRWKPSPAEAAISVTVGVGVSQLIVHTADGMAGYSVGAGSMALLHLALTTLAYTWVRRNRLTPPPGAES